MKKILIAMAVALASVSGIIAEETTADKPAAAGGPNGPSVNANDRAKENAERRRERKQAHKKQREERRAEANARREERRGQNRGKHAK
jgi:hypothetical protein